MLQQYSTADSVQEDTLILTRNLPITSTEDRLKMYYYKNTCVNALEYYGIFFN